MQGRRCEESSPSSFFVFGIEVPILLRTTGGADVRARARAMTAAKMRWQLIQGADGRPHLSIQWEAAQPAFVRCSARPHIHRSEDENRETHRSCRMFCNNGRRKGTVP